MTPVRVLWLIKSLNVGGAERLLEVMAARRDPAAVHVEIAHARTDLQALVPQIARHGVAVHDLGARDDLDLSWVRRLRRLVRGGRFDVLHSHSPLTGGIARATVTGVAHVYTEHNVWDIYHPWTRRLHALTFPRNRRVVAVSRGVARSICDRVPPRRRPPIDVVYHGFDERGVRRGVEARDEARAALGIPSDVTVVGTVGIFRPQKRYDFLLKAFARLVHEGSDALLVLIGGGPLEPHLRSQAMREGTADRVVFTGVREDVQRLLPGLDVFVLSSIAEGLPVALLEAMAAGVPPVATCVGGVPEVVEHGRTGLLVPAGSVAALAEGMRALSDAETRAPLAAAASAAAGRYSIDAAWAELLRIYGGVRGSPAPVRASAGRGASPYTRGQESRWNARRTR